MGSVEIDRLGEIGSDKVITIRVPIFEQSFRVITIRVPIFEQSFQLVQHTLLKAREQLGILRCRYKEGEHGPHVPWKMFKGEVYYRNILCSLYQIIILPYFTKEERLQLLRLWVEARSFALSCLVFFSVRRSDGYNIIVGLRRVHHPLLQIIGTPLVNELTENKWQHHRGINSAFKDGSLQATQIHMVIAAEGTIDQPMYDMYIIDSGASLHCTGDRNLLTEYTPKEQPDESFRGASGKVMPVLGIGTICNGMFQVKNVKYMPSLNQPNINKTIFSVVELGKLGYHVHFDGASCSVIDKRNRTWSWKTWTWTHEIVGKAHLECKQYMVEYLRIPADRVPVTNPEGPTLAASFWKAASSGWASVTRLLTPTQAVCAERLPV